MTTEKSPLVLLILDGFGYSDDPKYNAIASANAPVWEKLWDNNPKTLIHTSGLAVGLPDGQMGNSEVGHMTLGAGRVVYQNFTRINKAIKEVKKLYIGEPASTLKRDVVVTDYQVTEMMFFNNTQDQDIYQVHPIHKAFVENYSHLWEKVVVYDMLVD